MGHKDSQNIGGGTVKNNLQSQYMEVTARLCDCSGNIAQSEHIEIAT